ncbi:hypothetical protein BKA63DRAFT_568248 [Paraphoma chrysanthemicola]|nr:hypothetical protein BKA63DRAFT_568248 [Paraphoma chrysanthemicola]
MTTTEPTPPKQPTAVATLAHIAELVGMIVLNLSLRNLLRAQLVSPFWRGVITGSRATLRILHKLPNPPTNEANPHFKQASAVAQTLTGKYDPLNETHVLEHCDAKTTTLVDSMHPELPRDIGKENIRLWRSQLFRCRYACRDIRDRRTDTWPSAWNEIHCHLCNTFHTKFLFSNVHPILNFLEDSSVCFRGHGARLVVVKIIGCDSEAPNAIMEEEIQALTSYAGQLRLAFDQIWQCRLENDMFMRPVCTRLISRWGPHVVDNAAGLTLQEVIESLIKMLKTQVPRKQAQIREQAGRDFGNWNLATGGLPATYLKVFVDAEGWQNYVDQYSEIVRMFDEAATVLNTVFAGVDIWNDELLCEEDLDAVYFDRQT